MITVTREVAEVNNTCSDCGRPRPVGEEWLATWEYEGGVGCVLTLVCPSCINTRLRESGLAAEALKRAMRKQGKETVNA